jgi:hypothetical protein
LTTTNNSNLKDNWPVPELTEVQCLSIPPGQLHLSWPRFLFIYNLPQLRAILKDLLIFQKFQILLPVTWYFHKGNKVCNSLPWFSWQIKVFSALQRSVSNVLHYQLKGEIKPLNNVFAISLELKYCIWAYVNK